MMFTTFKKETKELLREGRVKMALVIVLLLLGIAVLISAKKHQDINETYAIAKKAERDIWDNQGEKNPHSAAHYGTYAFKPKYPLSLLDQGVDKYTGTAIFLEAHKRNEAQFSAAADQTGLARFGDLTPDFILLFIFPLLIILLGYNSFTKEREMGTLTLLKSQGIIPWKWVFGKWLALFFPIFILSLVLFALAAFLLSSLNDFGVLDWGAFTSLFLVYVGYYIIFINMVLFISSRVKNSGIALVLNLCIWIIACLGAPKAASNLAEHQYPYPNRQTFAANILKDKKEGLDGHNPWNKEAKLLEEKVLKEYGVDSLHQLPFNYAGYRMQKGEEHQAAVYVKHYNLLKQQYSKQAKMYQGLALISPYLPTRFLSMAIAQTDYATHWNFADAAETYRVATQKFLNDNLKDNSSFGDWQYMAGPDTWKDLPTFTYHPPELGEILWQNSANLLVLILWILGSFVFLFITPKTA